MIQRSTALKNLIREPWIAGVLLVFLCFGCGRSKNRQSEESDDASNAEEWNCSNFPAIVPINKVLNSSLPNSKDSNPARDFWLAKIAGAEWMFGYYKENKWKAKYSVLLANCLSTLPDGNSFYAAQQQVFFEKTVDDLSRGRHRKLILFTGAVKNLSNTFFRLLSHSSGEESLPNRPGGFHRGRRSLFMDFDMISSKEWTVIFSHEIAHALDQQLTKSVQLYRDPHVVKSIVTISQLSGDTELSSQQRTDLRAWLTAGLDRGFLGEYRAWLVTLSIYYAGREENLWPRINWLEQIAPQSESSQMRETLFRYLDSRFQDPEDGLFAKSIIKSELTKLRLDLRSNPASVDIGNLAEYL